VYGSVRSRFKAGVTPFKAGVTPFTQAKRKALIFHTYFRGSKTKFGLDFRPFILPGYQQTNYHKRSCLLPSGCLSEYRGGSAENISENNAISWAACRKSDIVEL
jgi:hypothetical protein